mmetsp:Transcript_50239/g.151234  ORF Transcript_50239/g.151234 Transcript_50239/m.151234 type:complete len:333 (-) Transcript_50239:208-1206(-)
MAEAEKAVCDPVLLLSHGRDESRNTELVRDVHGSYRELFNIIITSVQRDLEEKLLLSADQSDSTWRYTLNSAVKDGSPADFSDPDSLRIYAVNKLMTRCRYLYLLIMDDNPLSAKIRSLFLPSLIDDPGTGCCRICSIGGGPGYDHVVGSAIAHYMRRMQPHSNHFPGSEKLAEKLVQTQVFDLYHSDWLPIMNDLVDSCNQVEGSFVTMHHADLRLSLCATQNHELGMATLTADMFCFQFVLHENASFLERDSSTGEKMIGGAVWDILCNAKVGAFMLCTDSGNVLWPAVKNAAVECGWGYMGSSEMKQRIKLGPSSFVMLERLVQKNPHK